MNFEQYIAKIASLIDLGGYLLFESHNVFGQSLGSPGDDGDMDLKIKIINKYFSNERYRMVHCFLEHNVEDVDKLFIVGRRVNRPRHIEFNLSDARTNYDWTFCK